MNEITPLSLMDDPATIESVVQAGTGAGVITWAKENWLKTTY